MHAVDMYDIIKTYVLPNAYERETYRIYRSSILRILRRCCVFHADNESKPRLACGLDEYRDNE